MSSARQHSAPGRASRHTARRSLTAMHQGGSSINKTRRSLGALPDSHTDFVKASDPKPLRDARERRKKASGQGEKNEKRRASRPYLVRDGLPAPATPVRRESRPVRVTLVKGDLGDCGAVRANEGVDVLPAARHLGKRAGDRNYSAAERCAQRYTRTSGISRITWRAGTVGTLGQGRRVKISRGRQGP